MTKLQPGPGAPLRRRPTIQDLPCDFGLWSVRFPPVLVRTGRRLPVQALGERGVLVSVTGYPRGGPRDRVEALSPGLPEIKEKSGIWNLVPVG